MGSAFIFFLGWRKFSKIDADPKFFVDATFFEVGVDPPLISFAFWELCTATSGNAVNESTDFLFIDFAEGLSTPTAAAAGADGGSNVWGTGAAFSFFRFLDMGFGGLPTSPLSSVFAYRQKNRVTLRQCPPILPTKR